MHQNPCTKAQKPPCKKQAFGAQESVHSQGEPFLWEKQWYPLAYEGDLDPTRPHPVQLLGKDLVLWRDGEGAWHCFEDLCPHRLAPLSGRLPTPSLPFRYTSGVGLVVQKDTGMVPMVQQDAGVGPLVQQDTHVGPAVQQDTGTGPAVQQDTAISHVAQQGTRLHLVTDP